MTIADAPKRGALVLALLLAPVALTPAAHAYPGGTPDYQTDVIPYCAACHSSRTTDELAGAPAGRAEKELAEHKHIAQILAGTGGYKDLSPAQREQLAAHVRAVDAASTVKLSAPATVKAGQVFRVTVDVTGGDGPAAGVALVDAAHRWYARPAPAAGWQVVEEPMVLGQDFKQQEEWLSRRPKALDRNLSFVNVLGIHSDAVKGDWARAQVIWKLRAPATPGKHPLAACYWYGTELASPLGVVEDPIRGKLVRGGFGGASGRILFSPVQQIEVTR